MRFKENQISIELLKIAVWKLHGKEIVRIFKFKDFVKSIAFVQKVAVLAEKFNHHPDILIRYNRVTLRLTTHDEGGLTEKDFHFAEQINLMK